jgi:hypothetical protein
VDLAAKKIMPGVAIKSGDNPDRLRNKGSPVKLICWGLVGPKRTLKKKSVNGKTVNIPLPSKFRLTLWAPQDYPTTTVVVVKYRNAGSVVMTRTA